MNPVANNKNGNKTSVNNKASKRFATNYYQLMVSRELVSLVHDKIQDSQKQEKLIQQPRSKKYRVNGTKKTLLMLF